MPRILLFSGFTLVDTMSFDRQTLASLKDKLSPANLPIVQPSNVSVKVSLLPNQRHLSPAAEASFINQFSQSLNLKTGANASEILLKHGKEESFIVNAQAAPRGTVESSNSDISYRCAIKSSAQHKLSAPLEASVENSASELPLADHPDDHGVYSRQINTSSADPAFVEPSSETQRKCQIAHVFFLDYYFDLLTYLHKRKMRTMAFKRDAQGQQLSEEESQKAWKYYCGKERAFLRKRRRRTNVGQFQILKQVGQGGYGQVFLARKRDTNEICALKKLNKKLLLKMNEVQHVLTERDILTFSQSEWLVRLLYAFQDPEYAFLAMEFVPGGDMRTLLNNSGILREEPARFYIAEMITAVDALHQLGYLHRDLKPENFLIDSKGHIKLTDFGLSKGALSASFVASLRGKLEMAANAKPVLNRCPSGKRKWHQQHSAHGSISGLSEAAKQQLAAVGNNAAHQPFVNSATDEDLGSALPSSLIDKHEGQSLRTWAFSLVGSPDYMAPEILANKGYDLVADYWGLGCILFEFLAGYPPFTAPNVDDVWVNIYHWEKVLERPVYTGVDAEFNISNEAWDLITKLITHRSTRLCNVKTIQALPFFARLPTPIPDFSMLRKPVSEGGIDPPFVPALQSEVDTSYFDDFSNLEDMKVYKEVQERQAQLEMEYGTFDCHASLNGAESGSKSQGLRRNFMGFTYKHRDHGKFLPDVLY